LVAVCITVPPSYRRVLDIFFFMNYAVIFIQQLRQGRTNGENWNTK